MPTVWGEKEPFFGPINVDDVAAVDAAIQKMVAWNRYDLIDSLNRFLSDKGRPQRLPRVSARRHPLLESPTEEEVPSPGNQVHLFNPTETLPVAPQKLNVHRHSAVAFMKGKCGHAYTGLIRRKEKDEGDKLFLFPLDPRIIKSTQKTPQNPEGLSEERRGGRDFGRMKAQVYKQELEPPIVHGGKGSDATSHGQLAQKVLDDKRLTKLPNPEKKSGNETPEEGPTNRADLVDKVLKTPGLFIGFTVHKGDLKRGVANRFRMVSASFNGKAFPVGLNPIQTFEHWSRVYDEKRLVREYPEKLGKPTFSQVFTDTQATLPESWAFLIKKTVDWLLQFQGALEQQRPPLSHTLIWLDDDNSLSAKNYWRLIKASPGSIIPLPSPEQMKLHVE